MKPKLLWIFTSLVVMSAVLPATGVAGRTVKDASNRLHVLPDKVDRIICSGPGCLRLVTYLQAEDRVVADMTAVITMHDINAALRYADQYICRRFAVVFSARPVSGITPEILEAVYGVRVDMLHHEGYPIVIPKPDTKAA